MQTERQYPFTEILAWENNDLAIENAIETLKSRLAEAPEGVANDVLGRCDPDTHAGLIDWLGGKVTPTAQPVPKAWSPNKNARVWLLYKAADLECPADPPYSRLPM
jgi:hypothetical protein